MNQLDSLVKNIGSAKSILTKALKEWDRVRPSLTDQKQLIQGYYFAGRIQSALEKMEFE